MVRRGIITSRLVLGRSHFSLHLYFPLSVTQKLQRANLLREDSIHHVLASQKDSEPCSMVGTACHEFLHNFSQSQMTVSWLPLVKQSVVVLLERKTRNMNTGNLVVTVVLCLRNFLECLQAQDVQVPS